MPMFEDVVSSAGELMGVKAVFSASTVPVMCFGSRGDAVLKDRGHFAQARTTAERAQQQPYFLTIGGGEHVPDALRGRVLELIRATGVYGETTAFVLDEVCRKRLVQWPVAIVASEVYTIAGEPHLVDDLGFADRRILANAYDSVLRDEELIQQLWNALRSRAVGRRWEISPPPGFRDPGKVQLYVSLYPKLDMTSEEGKRVWKLSRSIERDLKLAKAAKALNRKRNKGVLVCEACPFSDDADSMLDAHHRVPLAAGLRASRVDDLLILCPTCHRWAHIKATDPLSPLELVELSEARAGRNC